MKTQELAEVVDPEPSIEKEVFYNKEVQKKDLKEESWWKLCKIFSKTNELKSQADLLKRFIERLSNQGVPEEKII